ncbi:sulfotransferase 1C4-like [Saccoglossus kowalevskii]|uniref:Sulfotransferase 1C4-like n=1 Tax=Saccoglossus kowalevskii TaxID=10224 RepID=A0ABM0MW25_SACKO|nr:PREDICTED: sulfotransferase 1C4-like [Saccoglossus kowalevskii]
MDEKVIVPGTIEYNGITLPPLVITKILESPDIVKCRDDDVFVVSYRKVYIIVRQPMQLFMHIMKLLQWILPRFLHLDNYVFVPPIHAVSAFDGLRQIERIPSPRLIKSHLPYKFFPPQALEKKCKIIYVARNPKDTAVPLYYMMKLMPVFGIFFQSWNHFYQLFSCGKAGCGDWFDHLLDWHKHKEEDNIMFLKYEDIKKDIRATIKKIALFLDIEVTDDVMQRIVEYSSIKK